VVIGATGLVTPSLKLRAAGATTYSSVLCAAPPDPAPPGVASFAAQAFSNWQNQRSSYISYDPIAWPRLYQRLRSYFDANSRVYDLMYLANWAPEFHESLLPIDNRLPEAFIADLPQSSLNASTWSGEVVGCPTALSLLTLHYNTEHFARAGITDPPTTWDELKSVAQELTGNGQYGWLSNYGAPGGVGGTASYWMTYLQQAGGHMYDGDGMPEFAGEPGVDALQLMIDLMPFTHPGGMTNMGIVDATNAFLSGEASMMMNWPFMWQSMQQSPAISRKVGTALLPAGSAGSASIDGGEVWSIPRNNWHEELGFDLLAFFLEKPVQRSQAIETGWPPIRLSVLAEPAIQDALPYAATLLAQAQHPYNSFLSPDYDAITTALGTEIQLALAGAKTAAQALSDASDAVSAIVAARAST
jgi:multiple sugar transport system substrate-binding protein